MLCILRYILMIYRRQNWLGQDDCWPQSDQWKLWPAGTSSYLPHTPVTHTHRWDLVVQWEWCWSVSEHEALLVIGAALSVYLWGFAFISYFMINNLGLFSSTYSCIPICNNNSGGTKRAFSENPMASSCKKSIKNLIYSFISLGRNIVWFI